MLRILVPPAVLLASAVFVAVATGDVPRMYSGTPPAVLASTARQQPVAPKQHVRPLVLPNIGLEVRKLQAADRSVAVKQMVLSGNVIRFWRNHRWILAPRHEKCWMVPWQRSCTAARASLRLHKALSAHATYLVDHEIPLINDWRTAVHWVQRIYPGTEQWMLYISDREGDWDPWVWFGERH
jgi:hypothetical protein